MIPRFINNLFACVEMNSWLNTKNSTSFLEYIKHHFNQIECIWSRTSKPCLLVATSKWRIGSSLHFFESNQPHLKNSGRMVSRSPSSMKITLLFSILSFDFQVNSSFSIFEIGKRSGSLHNHINEFIPFAFLIKYNFQIMIRWPN